MISFFCLIAQAEEAGDQIVAAKYSQRARKFGIISILTWFLCLAAVPILMTLGSYLLTLKDWETIIRKIKAAKLYYMYSYIYIYITLSISIFCLLTLSFYTSSFYQALFLTKKIVLNHTAIFLQAEIFILLTYTQFKL